MYTNAIKGNDTGYFRLYVAVHKPKYIQARQKMVGFLPRLWTEAICGVFFLGWFRTEAGDTFFFFSENEDFCLFKIIFFSFFIWDNGGDDEIAEDGDERRRWQWMAEGDNKWPKAATNGRRRWRTVSGDQQLHMREREWLYEEEKGTFC